MGADRGGTHWLILIGSLDKVPDNNWIMQLFEDLFPRHSGYFNIMINKYLFLTFGASNTMVQGV